MYLDFPVILYFIQSLQLAVIDLSINHSFPSHSTSGVHTSTQSSHKFLRSERTFFVIKFLAIRTPAISPEVSTFALIAYVGGVKRI